MSNVEISSPLLPSAAPMNPITEHGQHKEAGSGIEKPGGYLRCSGFGSIVALAEADIEELCLGKQSRPRAEWEGRGKPAVPSVCCCVGNSLYLWDLVKCQENPEGEAAALLLRCSSPWSPWELQC